LTALGIHYEGARRSPKLLWYALEKLAISAENLRKLPLFDRQLRKLPLFVWQFHEDMDDRFGVGADRASLAKRLKLVMQLTEQYGDVHEMCAAVV
jgi:hypothetical protein